MAFTYTAEGGFALRGCADFVVKERWIVRFGVGSAAYVCAKAEFGVIEKVVIKDIYVNGPYRIIVYKDNTNRVWLESELCDGDTAKDTAEAYLAAQLEKLKAMPCLTS